MRDRPRCISRGLRNPSASSPCQRGIVGESVPGFTRRAFRKALRIAVELEYRFQVLVVQAPGAKVMHGLSILARLFKAKGERSRVVLDQLIAFSLGNALFKVAGLVFKFVYASQQRALALGALRILFLHRDDMRQGDRQFHLQFVGGRNDLRFVLKLYGRLVGADCIGDHRKDGGDVHKGSPNVEKGGVGASDSTLRGNLGDGGGHG